MKAIRVGVGGFLCETDTLAPTKASYDDFERGSGWPAMARGSGALAATPGANVVMSGFVAAAEARG
jgi:microcystin degradation protein MlrC